MFTGIVQAKVKVDAIERKPGLITLDITLPSAYADNIKLGASIAVDGVCLTVTYFDVKTGRVSFDIMQQTLDLTALSGLNVGDWVNIERSAKLSDEVGGHNVSGHCDAVVTISSIETTENNQRISYHYPEHYNKYLFEKGFVALNGCSLTIASIDKAKHILSVAFIPETLKTTTHGLKQLGQSINLELDRQTQTIVDTVERVLLEHKTD